MHIHTTFSDGTHSPEEVVKIAKDKGLSLISVCDHDNIRAYERLKPACESQGLELVTGVEIGVEWGGRYLHLLAYNIDLDNQALLELMNSNQAESAWADRELIRKMEQDFPNLSLDEFTSYEMPVGRGGWSSVNYIFDKGVSNSVFDSYKFYQKYDVSVIFGSIVKACDVIKGAGGVPVLAHPGEYWQEDELEEKLTNILPTGILGLECYHPSPNHTDAVIAKCVDFCKAHDLCITCGGDCHGDFAQSYRGMGVMKIDSSLLNLKGIV